MDESYVRCRHCDSGVIHADVDIEHISHSPAMVVFQCWACGEISQSVLFKEEQIQSIEKEKRYNERIRAKVMQQQELQLCRLRKENEVLRKACKDLLGLVQQQTLESVDYAVIADIESYLESTEQKGERE